MFDVPADQSTRATLDPDSPYRGNINLPGDRDWIAVTLSADRSYDLVLGGAGATPLGDPYLRLFDARGVLVAEDDDSGGGRAARIAGFVPALDGVHYVEVAGFGDANAGRYALSMTASPPPLPVYDHDRIARQLSDGFWEWLGETRRAFDVGDDHVITYDASALTASGRRLANAALDAWADVTGLRFRAVGEAAQIVFDDAHHGAYSTSDVSDGTILGSTVNISTSWLVDYGTSLASYSFQTYIHEIGHALGLGHAGNYDGTASYPQDALYRNDSWQATIMSYFSQAENSFIAADEATLLTPMIADILAIRSLYGFSGTTRHTDTVYGYAREPGSLFDPTTFPGVPVALTIMDTGGIDRINGAACLVAQRIDLRAETISDLYGLKGNIGIARGVVIEDATGGGGDDWIRGNAVANRLVGGAGDDTLAGDDGADVLRGDAGADCFCYLAATDSGTTIPQRDRIMDFTAGEDVIDLSAIDAVAGGADDLFSWIGGTGFSGLAGELRAVAAVGGLVLMADTDGDRRGDFGLRLVGITSLEATDFVF